MGHNAFMQSNSKGARSRMERRRSPSLFPLEGEFIAKPSYQQLSRRASQGEDQGATVPDLLRWAPRANNDPHEAGDARAPRRVPSNQDHLYRKRASRAWRPSLNPSRPDSAASRPHETWAASESRNHIGRDDLKSCVSPR